MRGAILAVLIWIGSCLGQTSQPSSQPVDRYAEAGQARRVAGIESWMFIHPTWINWRTAQYGGASAQQVLDGYLLVMLDADGARPVDGLKAALRLCEMGCSLKILPGLRVAAEEYAGWTDAESWQRDLDLLWMVRQGWPEGPIVIDAEPYGLTGKRYPTADLVHDMWSAMGAWQQVARDTELWITPGGPTYWNVWVMASLRARQGPVYLLDQGTFSRPDNTEALIRQRKAFLDGIGMTYVPGFYLRNILDVTLYEMLGRCGITRVWFFAQAVPDEYHRFGLSDWQHAQGNK